ncbi:MAG: hypothetical protein H6733_14610 [Alphaproteobacteria bacterium]|nr:hypothetical protein [Alphaproteobacteria bacterium]
MTPPCPHAHTTTVAWLYGESPDDGHDHALHVATCADCQATAALHADLIATTAPVLPAVRTTTGPSAARVARHVGARVLVASVLAVAAALAVVLGGTPGAGSPATTSAPVAQAPHGAPARGAAVDLTTPDDLDLRLDALQGEVAALSLDFASL